MSKGSEACSSQVSKSHEPVVVHNRTTKQLSKQDLKYSVVKFNEECEEDETYSVIPTFWLKDDKYTYWPKKDTRNSILKCKKPRNDWMLYPVTVLAKYDLYEHALRKEKRLMEDKSSNNESENLGRGLRKRMIPNRFEKENDNSSDSSKTDKEENSISDNDSIPDKTLDEQDNDDQNVDGDTQIMNIYDLPVVIETENNTIPVNNTNQTLDSILRYVIEIKILCTRLDNRLHNVENGNHVINNHNTDMIPQLPMNQIEDIDNFEAILVAEEAQSQLVNMLVLIGGVTSKDALKRALQKLFSNNLASKCSWTGAKNNFKLKDLKIITCIKSAIKKSCPAVTEAEFEENLKTWFRQANLRLTRENARANAANNDA